MKNIMKNENTRKIILTVVFILLAIVLLIGSSYAYFTLGVDTSQSHPTTITGRTTKLGNVTLKGLIEELHLNLSASDMALSNARDYYATKEKDKNYELEEEQGTYDITSIQVENVENETKHNCTAEIKVIIHPQGENDMIEAIEQEDLYLYLKGGDLEETIDMYEFKGKESESYPVTFKTTGNVTEYIKAYVKLVNKTDPQNYLAGKNLSIEITTENLKCSTDRSMTGLDLAKNNPENLTEDYEDGLRRFHGTAEQVTNNYICFGTNDNCYNGNTTNEDYQYRIMGIEENTGRLKLIKNTTIDLHEWNYDYSKSDAWPNTTMMSFLNIDSAGFYNNIKFMPEDWRIKIDTNKWNIGDVNVTLNNEITTNANTVSTAEKKNQIDGTETNKIGLMYLSDYYYAYNDGLGTADCYKNNCLSWLTDTSNDTWTMTRKGQNEVGNYEAWLGYSTGNATWNVRLTTKYGVRPAFYITADFKIASGKGTIEDPYIFEVPEKGEDSTLKGKELAQEIFGETPTGFNPKFIRDLYRFIGTQEDVVNNYICFSTTDLSKCLGDQNDGNTNYMYRIIGITKDGNLKLQKYKSISTYQWNDFDGENTPWPNNSLTSKLSDFLNNRSYVQTDDNGVNWKNKIQPVTWNTGIVDQYGPSRTGDEIYNFELKTTVSSRSVGLAYLSDYYFAFKEDGTQNCRGGNICKSWILPVDYTTLFGGNETAEWTMAYAYHKTGGFSAWAFNAFGDCNYGSVQEYNAIRPVFYLTSGITLTANGDSDSPKGSLNNPWIIG